MALSGLDIYKLLPKTNCRQCGFPTCLAFALSLAKKAVVLAKCPFVSEQAKAALEAQSQPPIKLITLGDDANKVEVGNETVLFRHEEKFHHPCAIGFIIEDSLSNQEITQRLEKIKQFHFERVGQLIKTDLIAIKQTQTGERFIEVLKLVSGANQPLALISNDKTALEGALKILAGKKPLIYAADSENLSGFSSLAKEHNASLAVKADSIDSLCDLAAKVKESGVLDILIALNSNNKPARTLWELTQIRRQALKKNNRNLGYPVIAVIEKLDSYQELIKAGDYIAKYAGIILLNTFEEWAVLSLLTLRQNIYTDPQKPLQIEPKLYPIGNTTENSPVLVTTNFSLSYYTVLGEVEASKVPTNILSVDTEGMSVLTAWAAEKFTPDKISDSLKKSGIEEKIKHHNLIIPGYVAVMSGELEEKSGWKIVVGPKEAAGIPSFLKNLS
ncbi:MAG: acetyl-CoA decarbonylase/synthase complex subunit gamma [Omnitrophica WOR_2 bacterium RIFOXYB2_FULL_45_11]|nr:MAG: acetyl-CoA decarbonylase/synthase complex subunit gamma [Omnitrophica WOR_2 bacterium RIFOXYB2_FULL_45_11]OGX61271.1 MAG: acetyl-CoA decarbonylase/synthase complex subunit gamma [Omnitrophica WOR_2 bacterium RIFOXYC2_FULL_45_15]